MIVGRHVYYTGQCKSCGVRRYVRRVDGLIGKHSPKPYPRGACAGAGLPPVPGTLQCRECKAPVRDDSIKHTRGCVYMKGGYHEVPPNLLAASGHTPRYGAPDQLEEQ